MPLTRKKRGRAINGILVLDKPAGISSNGALNHVKRLYNANKAGHTGTLDIPATGLLPICLGEATKISAYLLDANKTYRADCQLGVTTTTGDATGEELVRSPVPEISRTALLKVLAKFIGETEQVPPMHSALKQNGKRLYELAYKGLKVERKARKITIHQLELLQLKHDVFQICVSCTKGTYIRTLVEDIGQALGCGVHLLSLRRLEVGPFYEAQMITPMGLQKADKQGILQLDRLLLPMDTALTNLPEVRLSKADVCSLRQGQTITTSELTETDRLKLYSNENEFLGLGEVTKNGLIKPKRLINKK